MIATTATVLGVLMPAGARQPVPGTPPPVAAVHDDVLPHRAQGGTALRLLGAAGLTTAAARNDVSPDRLRSLLAHDPSAWVDTAGRLYYVEPSPADATAAQSGTATTTATTTAPLGDTWRLHSLPGAQRTIYLDFDGGTVESTWVNAQAGLPSTSEPAWDPAHNGASFSDAELASVREVWARVAEDFSPFTVDVTTETPSSGALDRSGSTDQAYGVQVLVGPSHAVWDTLCSRQCGGIAPLGVFDEYLAGSDRARYAWVFTDGLADVPKYVAEAAAHEAGHTLGLNHDGSTTDPDYYAGTALWGPIMGAPYDSAVTQWSKGEYPGATNVEDDLAMIGASSMAPRRSDEAGGTIASAGEPPDGPAWITSASDVDVFDLGNCAGTVSLRADPAPAGPDLDISLALVDDTGATVATDDPPARAQTPTWPQPVYATGLGATVSTSVASGRHLYARVRGAAAGGWSTGYGPYGSVGAYRLGVAGCASPLSVAGPPQNLTVHADPVGGTVTADWTPPVSSGGSVVTGYQVSLDGSVPQSTAQPAYVFRSVAPGPHEVSVRAVNQVGPGPAATAAVTLAEPPTVPGGVRSLRAVADPSARSVTLTWSPPADDGGSGITAYRVHQYDARGTDLGARPVAGDLTRVTLSPVVAGQTVRFGVAAVNQVGNGPAMRGQVTMPAPPGAPVLGRVAPGPAGGRVTATVRWSPPLSNGGAAITGYRIAVLLLDARGRVSRTRYVSVGVRASMQVRVARDRRYRFTVQAVNRVGYGAWSARSKAVRGR